jgi:hypothetical protein
VSEFISSAEAFRVARERASVAAAFEASTLHLAVFDARESGLSVRETAAALGVPKSTVARHWREMHSCSTPLPMWGSPSAWREAHEKVWAHNPRELADVWVPFEWSDEGDRRTVQRRRRGVAVLRSDNTPPVDDDAAQ